MSSALDALTEQVRAAVAAKRPLRIRGGGSKDFYRPGGQGDLQGELLDTTPLNGIVSYEPSELVVTVKAGTPLAELEAVLAEKNQCLPFEPPHFDGGATVGGMVAAGLAGPARACVGGVRDYVLGLELLNGRAELLRFGGTVMKNVAGYDVSRLMVGAMGTLGLVTEVSLKVLPKAPAEATLRFEMDEATALKQLNTWAGQPLPLNASSWVVDAGVPTLYLRLRGARAAVDAACALFKNRHGAVRVDSPETSADWRAARDLTLPWFADGLKAAKDKGRDLWRISVPPTTPPLALGDTMVDWLGGQRWLFVDGADGEAAAGHGQAVQQAARAAGGSASVFIANDAYSMRANAQFDGERQTKEAAGAGLPAPLAAIQRRLKDEFDPLHIFNPGRLIAGL